MTVLVCTFLTVGPSCFSAGPLCISSQNKADPSPQVPLRERLPIQFTSAIRGNHHANQGRIARKLRLIESSTPRNEMHSHFSHGTERLRWCINFASCSFCFPAKNLNPTNPEAHSIVELTSPVFLNDVEKLTQALSQWDLTTTMARLKLSENMAKRAMEWHKSWQRQGGHAAGWTFQGDAFKSLDLPSFADEHVWAAQRRLRILNGAYGLLRPLDRYRPVRLNTNCAPSKASKHDSLLASQIEQLALESSELGTSRILNLASSEYGDVALHGRQCLMW